METSAHPDASASALDRWTTAAERSVVALVATGLATQQIAARLGVSVRTVENHLSHVYAKTGMTSRVRLAICRSSVARSMTHLALAGGRPPVGGREVVSDRSASTFPCSERSGRHDDESVA